MAFILATAGIFGMPYLDRWYHQVYVEKKTVIAGDKVSIPGRVLTVYFSRVGNTNFPSDVDAVSGASIMKDGHEIIGNAEMIAYMVQNATGGDIFSVRTGKEYPPDYGETTKEGKRELESGKAPNLKGPLPQMENYDVIFLVYPLWWNTLPMPMEGFLKQYDWKGKTLIPIVTHGGGGIGESLNAIQNVTQTNTADSYLDIYSSDIPALAHSFHCCGIVNEYAFNSLPGGYRAFTLSDHPKWDFCIFYRSDAYLTEPARYLIQLVKNRWGQ